MMCIERDDTNDMYIPVTINTKITSALLDTGIPYSLMTRAVYKSIPKMDRWTKFKLPMKGLASQPTYSLGYVKVKVTIDNDDYVLQFFIVEITKMTYETYHASQKSPTNRCAMRLYRWCRTTSQS